MNKMLKIINKDKTKAFELTPEKSIQLELSLNVTKYGNAWSHIGDALYKYGSEKKEVNKELPVTNEQFEFLSLLVKKEDWRDCTELSFYTNDE